MSTRSTTRFRLVLLHGFTGAAESWDAVVRSLPPSVSVFRPTLLGHGPTCTRADEGVADFEGEVDRLLRCVRQRVIEPVVLAGYSLGGRVALRMLHRQPHLFRAALLIGVHPGLESVADLSERRARDAGWIRLLRTEGLARFVSAWEAQPLFRATQSQLSGSDLETQRRIRLEHTAEGLARSLDRCGLASMPAMWADLPRLSVPTVWMVGATDRKFRDLAARASAVAPASRVEVVPGAGHNVVLERPAAVTEALRMFVAPREAQAPGAPS